MRNTNRSHELRSVWKNNLPYFGIQQFPFVPARTQAMLQQVCLTTIGSLMLNLSKPHRQVMWPNSLVLPRRGCATGRKDCSYLPASSQGQKTECSACVGGTGVLFAWGIFAHWMGRVKWQTFIAQPGTKMGPPRGRETGCYWVIFTHKNP